GVARLARVELAAAAGLAGGVLRELRLVQLRGVLRVAEARRLRVFLVHLGCVGRVGGGRESEGRDGRERDDLDEGTSRRHRKLLEKIVRRVDGSYRGSPFAGLREQR